MSLDTVMSTLVDAIADRVVERVRPLIAATGPSDTGSPWMTMDEAITYTRIGESTFRKDVAAGRIPSHTRPDAGDGAKKYFHRAELDAMLGYDRGDELAVIPLRKAS